MKKLLSIVFIVVVFIGCTPKQEVEINIPNEKVNKDLGKPITNDFDIGEKIGKEEIESLDPLDIKEDEFSFVSDGKSINIAVVSDSACSSFFI